MAYFDADMDAEGAVDDRADTEFKIYVNNLPMELNESAIKDIFGQYGEVMEMFHPRNTLWAYITYRTYREAELAIRELDSKKPLNLKVALAKDRSTREEVNYEKVKMINNRDSPPSLHCDVEYQNMGRGHSVNTLRKHVMPQITVPSKHTGHGSSLPMFSQIHNVYEIEDPYMCSNRLWTRGVVTVTSDGKRHVSLGRGYTAYEYPEPHPKIEDCILKVYEHRNNGLYEYSEDKCKNGVQNCSVCSTKTTKHCEKCLTYYCGRTCQLEDWPQHQAECERIPALVEETNSISLQINKDINQINKISTLNINKTATSGDVKLRRPNTYNATQAENSNNTNVNIDVHKSSTEVTHNSVNYTQNGHVSAQYDNDINVSQTRMTNQPVTNQHVTNQHVTNATNTKEIPQQHQARKHYNTNENIDQSRKNSGYSSSGSTDLNYHGRNYQNDSQKTNNFKGKYGNSNVRNRTYNNDNKNHSFQRNGFQKDKSSADYNGRENTNKETNTSSNASVNSDVDFYKDTHLSKTKFIPVEVIISDNDEYWITKLEDMDARNDLMMKLQDMRNSRNMQPVIGEVYGVLFETLWHRAMVTSLNPIKVHFIDFGNYETLEKNAAIKDIGDLTKSPKFARKIRLTQDISKKYRNLQEGEKISVRMLSVDSEKTITVEVKEEQLLSKNLSLHTTESASNNVEKNFLSQENSKVSLNESTNASIIQIPSVLDALADLSTQNATSELQIEGYIQIHESSQKNVYSATLSPQVYSTEMGMVLDDIQSECFKIQTPTNYKPKAEELVCGHWNDGTDAYWFRGYISACPETSSKPSIFAIDEARILSVDRIVPCPKEFLNICAFGVMCEINHSSIEEGKPHEFTAIIKEKSYKQKSLEIKITTDSGTIQAVVKTWGSTNSSSLFELKNGSKVCLTSYRNHYCMFVRSLEEVEVEYYHNIMQSVAQHAQTAPHLTEPPSNGEVVIAPFDGDGNSYRAMILNTQNANDNAKRRVVYIDFGNIAEVDIKDLKVMPQSCSQQSCTVKVMLKDIPRDVPSNQEVDTYLRTLLGKEEPLMCTFEGSSKDGVRLTTLTGECVNDKINELLLPGWKKEKDDNTCYMLRDIKVASLGPVGDTVDAIVLFVREDDRTTYMMGPTDIELLTHVFNVMPTMLKEYCEEMEYYIPRAQELCVALYDGAWYRAACLNPKESHTTAQILFIDYGNIESIEHKDIRLMPKDFIVPSAVANLCTIVNLAPVDSNGKYSKAVQKKLEELMLMNSSVKIKIVECFDNGDYKIELPDVRAALIKHGFV